MKKFIFTLFLTTVAIASKAHDFEVNGIFYNMLTNTTAEVTFKGNHASTYENEYTGSVTIPEKVTYNGYTYSVTRIGDSAFYHCSGLTSVNIPTTVISIGAQAFYSSGLTSISIPKSVLNIGERIFSGCLNITNITVDSNNPIYDSRNSCKAIIEKFSNTLIAGCKKTDIPSTVKSIGNAAFENCTALTSLTLPNSLTSLGDSAFYNCNTLAEISLPKSLVTIGSSAFYSCKALPSIDIPNSVTTIGDKAFYYCTGLKSVTLANSVETIGAYAFASCSGLTSITIPNSVKKIKTDAFAGCKGLICTITTNLGSWCNIEFDGVTANPAAVTHNLFLNGKEIKDLVIPDTVTRIGDYAFYNCSELTSVTIPNSVINIGLDAFDECTKITKLEFGNSVKSIKGWAFHDCIGLTSIVMPNSLETLGACAFANCSGIKSLTISNSLTKIENSTFYKCTGITSVNIPNSVSSIEQSAFDGCSKLATVTIPESVTKMANDMFSNCPSLITVYNYATTPQRIYSSSFSNAANCILYVPFGCKVTYEGTQYWKDFKEIREMEPTAIEGVDATNAVNSNIYYNINGTKSSTLHPGLNIIKTQKGVIKVLK